MVPGDYVIVFGTTNNNHRRMAVGAVDGRGGGRCRLLTPSPACCLLIGRGASRVTMTRSFVAALGVVRQLPAGPGIQRLRGGRPHTQPTHHRASRDA